MFSIWEKTHFLQYDYAVVGAGILGLSVAACLLERVSKAKVLVLERGFLPMGASTKNAGFACFGSPSEIIADIKKVGEQASLALIEKRWQGLHRLRQRLGDRALDFQANGGYELIIDSSPEEAVVEQLPYLNQLLTPLFGQAIFSLVPQPQQHFGFGKSVKYLLKNDLEGQIDSGLMMQSLRLYVQQLGAKIATQTQVQRVEDTSQGVSLSLQTASTVLEVQARYAFVCTNAFIPQLFPQIPIEAGRGQVLVTKPLPHLAWQGTFHVQEGYYYFRNFGNRVIFGGGRNVDLKTENTTEIAPNAYILADLTQKLGEWILPHYQADINSWIDYHWAGIMGFSPNKQPLIQWISPQIALAFACNGMGVALSSSIAEELVAGVLG